MFKVLKKYKPTSAGVRNAVIINKKNFHSGKPLKSLTERLKNRSGRNNSGKIVSRHRGGGHKKIYRMMDFKNDVKNFRIIRFEYDPNRNAPITLVKCLDDERYVYKIMNAKWKIGETVGDDDPGAVKMLKDLPINSHVYNIESRPYSGAQFCRSAGSYAVIRGQEEFHTILKMKSNEIRKINNRSCACVGAVGLEDYNKCKLGKAGRMRMLGRRPKVRGMAMHSHEHPNGGKDSHTKGKIPKTKWGKIAKGIRTRKPHKMLIKRR